MGIHLKNDYSFLFQNLQRSQNQNQNRNNAAGLINSINLSEYHSIKSGAYGKAVSAYFKKQAEDGTDVKETGKNLLSSRLARDEAAKELTEISTDAEKVEKSAEVLIQKNQNSVFRKENGEYDPEKIYEAVAEFAKNFNALMEKADKSSYQTIEQKVDDIRETLEVYKDEMKSIGITVDDQTHKLGIAYDEFIDADMDAVRELFNGNTSMAYVVATRTSFVGAEAKLELNSMKNYTHKGEYGEQFHQGNLMNHIV